MLLVNASRVAAQGTPNVGLGMRRAATAGKELWRAGIVRLELRRPGGNATQGAQQPVGVAQQGAQQPGGNATQGAQQVGTAKPEPRPAKSVKPAPLEDRSR
jgi:hypothetical protein